MNGSSSTNLRSTTTTTDESALPSEIKENGQAICIPNKIIAPHEIRSACAVYETSSAFDVTIAANAFGNSITAAQMSNEYMSDDFNKRKNVFFTRSAFFAPKL